MNLKTLEDQELHRMTKELAQTEREVLSQILHHLREIERRKLFSDFGYGSLFEYAVKELKYSEGQAGRRVQAMRLIKEIPEVQKKIETGELSLTNISQAQSFFRETGTKGKPEKLDVLEKLTNKTSREGQKELLKLQPVAALPKEKERIITEDLSEVRFLMSSELKEQLEEVRALLGAEGAAMSLAELFSCMTKMSVEALRAKKFGAKRATAKTQEQSIATASPTPAQELSSPTLKNLRSIPKRIVHLVWQRDGGKCVKCQSKRNLNIDHIQPVALGGKSGPENLRLLCFNCNQRAAIKTFGVYIRNSEPREKILHTRATHSVLDDGAGLRARKRGFG